MTRRIPVIAPLAIFALLAAGHLGAQVAPAARPTAEETTIKLDPFNVSADSDVGFVAASSLAGGRIATALKDTPVAYSVMTREFLDAFNLTDTAAASNFSVNVQYNPGDGTNQGFGGNGAMWAAGASDNQAFQVRGQPVSTPVRNFFPYANTSDSFDLDRLDLSRGPNAVLFGIGNGGGALNTTTKQAIVGKNIRDVKAFLGSWDRYRLEVDVNQSINTKLAVRTNLLWTSGNTWRDNEWEDKKGAHLTATYKVTPRLTIRAEGEFINTRRAAAWQVFEDFVSGWDGVTTTDGPNASLTAAQLARAGIFRVPINFTYNPMFGDVLMNFENRFTTKQAVQGNPTGYLNGVPIATVGFGATTGAGTPQYPMQPIDNVPNEFASAMKGSPFFSLPAPHVTTLWRDPDHRAPTYVETGKDAELSAAYNLGDSLFLQIAGDINESPRIGRNDGRRGLVQVMIDVDRSLPNGTSNPGFLRPYVDSMYYRNYREEDYKNMNAQLVYKKETRLGRIQIGLMGGLQKQTSIALGDAVIIPVDWRASDSRAWNLNSGNANNIYGYHRRDYLWAPTVNGELPIRPVLAFDPVTGVQKTITPVTGYVSANNSFNNEAYRKSQFVQLAGNMDLFKNKLVLIAAGRRDIVKLNQVLHAVAGDYPTGWFGQYITELPAAPADFGTLTYVPKSAAGVATGPSTKAITRPRTTVNGVTIRAPQYANDRFQDDYNPPNVSTAANTGTVGAVFNVTRSIGVYANLSSTFNPQAASLLARDYFGNVLKPSASTGFDGGVRMTLPGGKFSGSVAYFDSTTKNTVTAGQTFDVSPAQGYTQYIQVPAVGNLNPIGDNQRNVPPSTGTATRNREAYGYEIEMVANVSSNFRIVFNAGISYLQTTSAFGNALQWITATEPTVKLQLQDAGIIFSGNDTASINPALNDPTKINQTAVQAAVDAWNTQHTVTIPGLLAYAAKGVAVTTNTGWRANLASDYRISSGPVKGLRIGAAINYFPRAILGNRVSDTIRDPNNPANAIDDPNSGIGNFVKGEAYFKTRGSLSYTFRLAEGRYRPKTIQVDLSIDNLLNNQHRLWLPNAGASIAQTASTVFAPRSGDVSDPSRVAVPGGPSIPDPRSFMLSAKLSF